MLHNYRTFLFDIDDTLIDFKHSEAISLPACYERYFQAYASYEDFLSDYGRFNHELWKQVEEGKIPSSEVGQERFKQVAAFYQCPYSPDIAHFYENALLDNSRWVAGAEKVLIEIVSKGLPLGFVTNGFTHTARSKYNLLELHRFSEVLVISEEIGCAKPHPQIFQYALELLNAEPEETLMIGDSLTSDGEGARRMNIPFCWFNPRQAPGPEGWQPDHEICCFKELKFV